MNAYTNEHNKNNREVTILLEEYLNLRENQEKLNVLLNVMCDRPAEFDLFNIKGSNVGNVIKQYWPDVYEEATKNLKD